MKRALILIGGILLLLALVAVFYFIQKPEAEPEPVATLPVAVAPDPAPPAAKPQPEPVAAPVAVEVEIEIPDGLLVHYSFDDGETETIADGSGSGHHGVGIRAKTADGVEGAGLKTSSWKTYVTCESVKLADRTDLTVSAWVKQRRLTTYGQVASCGDRGTQMGVFNLAIGGQLGPKPVQGQFGVRVGPKTSAFVRTPPFLELDVWHHIAGTYDGDHVRFYHNGKVLASAEVARTPKGEKKRSWEPDDSIMVLSKGAGHRWKWTDTHINGVIDEFMVFERALTPAEVRGLYARHADAAAGDGREAAALHAPSRIERTDHATGTFWTVNTDDTLIAHEGGERNPHNLAELFSIDALYVHDVAISTAYVWAATSNGLFRLSKDNRSWARNAVANKHLRANTTALSVDPDRQRLQVTYDDGKTAIYDLKINRWVTD